MENENNDSSWVVLKFGGTSVSSRSNWENIKKVIEARILAGEKPFIVCSALSGVSNLLEKVLAKAPEGDSCQSALSALHELHKNMAKALDIELPQQVEDLLSQLEELIQAARLTKEVTPRLHARVMSTGELMSTHLGAGWLKAQGLPVQWRDARDFLQAQTPSTAVSEAEYFLSARCDFEPNKSLQSDLAGEKGIILTQGFMARDHEGYTVLLGRGGSDTSAAYFASLLSAKRLEIWTDVPGMFTANPKEIPEARLIHRLNYEEAETLASLGAKVLHANCIAPVKHNRIPLEIHSTPHPELPGTTIKHLVEDSSLAGVKAISSQGKVCVLSAKQAEANGCPQEFFSKVTSSFSQCSLPLDHVSTSKSLVRATMDTSSVPFSEGAVEELISELDSVCKTDFNNEAASISLVGKDLRTNLHRLAAALGPLQGRKLHYMAESADDMSFTFVVERDDEKSLVRELHESLFNSGERSDLLFGPTWESLMSKTQPKPAKKTVEKRTCSTAS